MTRATKPTSDVLSEMGRWSSGVRDVVGGIVLGTRCSMATPKVREARDRYLAANGFTLDAYAAPFVSVSLFGLRFPFPNVGGLGRALPLHDLHHVALGYGTDLPGEAEICAWELRAGARNAPWIVRFIILEFVVLGLLVSPRRTLAAWRAARSSRTLFAAPLPYETLLDITVKDLRAHLRIRAT